MVVVMVFVMMVDGIYLLLYFEGVEKCIEIDFYFNERNSRGLREIARA